MGWVWLIHGEMLVRGRNWRVGGRSLQLDPATTERNDPVHSASAWLLGGGLLLRASLPRLLPFHPPAHGSSRPLSLLLLSLLVRTSALLQVRLEQAVLLSLAHTVDIEVARRHKQAVLPRRER